MPAFIEGKIKEGVALGLTEAEANRLAHRYGTNIDELYAILREKGDEAKASGLSLEVFASLVYGMDKEMVMTPSDFFIRRTSAMFFDVAWVQLWKDQVITYMADHFKWKEDQKKADQDELYQFIQEATKVMEEGGSSYE